MYSPFAIGSRIVNGDFVPGLASGTFRIRQGHLIIPETVIFTPDAAEVLPNGGFSNYYNFAATQTRPASKTAIEGLEKVSIDEKFGKVGQCAVCLEEFLVGAEVSRLPCSHFYHPGCIVEWLKNSNTCPVCRHEMSSC